MSYKCCVVFFIDILGSKNRNNFDETLRINQMFHQHLETCSNQNLPHVVYQRTVHSFSDCAYIIYDFKPDIEEERKDIRKLARIALYNTECLVTDFLAEGFLVRGGVTLGDIYYETARSLLFGPAVNRAYELENKIAIYPRIVVDQCVKNLVDRIKCEETDALLAQENHDFLKFRAENNGKIITKDNDSTFILNYFNSLQLGVSSPALFKIQNNLLDLIGSNLKLHANDQNIKKKYEWLEDYFNSSLSLANNLNKTSKSFFTSYL